MSARQYRSSLPDRPKRVMKLPTEERGYPVPWFIEWIDGKPDFRVMDARKLERAVTHALCWICGEQLGRNVTFVIGPMCAVNRVSAEPPSHQECANYAAVACPFLAHPKQRRIEGEVEGSVKPAGVMLERNPGVALCWDTRSFTIEVEPNGLLFRLGDPTAVRWYAHGRHATHEEVVASIDSGLPVLREMAEQEGPRALSELSRMTRKAMELVP